MTTRTRKPRRKLTNKQKVMRRWPGAVCHESVDHTWAIARPNRYENPWKYLTGWFPNPAQAWADAARRIG